MLTEEMLPLVIGGALTVLALIAGISIVVEVVQIIRELASARVKSTWWYVHDHDIATSDYDDTLVLRRRPRGRKDKNDTGPLSGHGVASHIKPVRDEAVVKQLIEHLKDDDIQEGQSRE